VLVLVGIVEDGGSMLCTVFFHDLFWIIVVLQPEQNVMIQLLTGLPSNHYFAIFSEEQRLTCLTAVVMAVRHQQ
jgi:hypothetical protein